MRGVNDLGVLQHTTVMRLAEEGRQAAPIGKIMHHGSGSGGVAKICRNGAFDSCSIATQIWGRFQGSSLAGTCRRIL